MINNPIIILTSFSKTLLVTERRLTGGGGGGGILDPADLFPTFLNTGTTDETFQQSGKQDS